MNQKVIQRIAKQRSPPRKHKNTKSDILDTWYRAKAMVDKDYPDFRSAGQSILDNPSSFSSNITFSRPELIDLYTRFKSLCVITVEHFLRM